MGFLKKIWKQRIVEYPGRRRLDDTSQPEVYDVSRAEGNVIQEGDGFTAVNMNGLENRIEQAFASADAMLSDSFSTTKAYASGDYVIYDNTLYRFTSAKPAGAWDASKAQATTVAGELGELNGNITDISNRMTAQEGKFATTSNIRLGYDMQEASVSGIPTAGYYVVNTIAQWENNSIFSGIQIAYGYYGTGKIYVRSFANGLVSYDWREL